MSENRGRFIWHDLMTSNEFGAQAFYTRVAGWGTQRWDQLSYTAWTNNGTPHGGVIELPDADTTAYWLAYVAVPDVAAALAQADALGARRIMDEDVPSIGRYAVLNDPQGAYFAIYTPASEVPGPDAAPVPGEFSWHELMTTNIEAAWAFYEAMFGWTRIEDTQVDGVGTYRVFGRGGREIGGMFERRSGIPTPPNWLPYINAASASAAAARVTAHGGLIMDGPIAVRGGHHVVRCVDPQGATFAIHATER